LTNILIYYFRFFSIQIWQNSPFINILVLEQKSQNLWNFRGQILYFWKICFGERIIKIFYWFFLSGSLVRLFLFLDFWASLSDLVLTRCLIKSDGELILTLNRVDIFFDHYVNFFSKKIRFFVKKNISAILYETRSSFTVTPRSDPNRGAIYGH